MRSWSSPSVPTLPAPAALPAPAESSPDSPPDGARAEVCLFDTDRGEVVSSGGPRTPATLYVCGITPYDATHLGHASTYLTFDLLVRAWRDAGRDVVYAQNVTDVDDPLLERAAQTGQDWRELAESQIELFRADMAALRVVPPDHYIGAVEAMDLIVPAVESMLESGAAYRVPTPDVTGPKDQRDLGDVYADLGADESFASGPHLAGLDLEAIFAQNGGDPEREGKRHPLDALLWRRSREGEPDWDGGALGTGRPGWHVECACIARHYLGDRIEVQGGGRDLIFPHHEMSEAHLRTLTGDEAPVDVHAHVGMVAFEGTKMSKSLGNLVLVSRLLAQGTDPGAVRLVVHAHHYRSDWEYTDDLLTAANERLEAWRRAVAANAGPDGALVLAQVRAALADDLDAPRAITAVDEWARAALDGAGADAQAPALVRDTVDALLGIAL